MNHRRPSLSHYLVLFIVVAGPLLALPALVSADGGIVTRDQALWSMMEEGQQIAVVRLQEDDRARIDLFVAIGDRSRQSHEVTYFVPLGAGAGDFGVVEEPAHAFNGDVTGPIESELGTEEQWQDDYKVIVRESLLLGSLATHGAWLSVFAYIDLSRSWPFMVGAWPIANFETPNSQVAIYDVDLETDLQELIETTGLDPKVKETLASLRGQQIAVVRLQTQPVSTTVDWNPTLRPDSLPGIHLNWRSTLVPHSSEATYTYPLGTGRAWASPIEFTRLYVVAPPGLDFRVEAPRLGQQISNSLWSLVDNEGQILALDIDGPTFATDELYSSFGHVWRATYSKSNSAEDVIVTRLAQLSPEARRAIRRAAIQPVILYTAWLVGLAAGIAAWITAWRMVMPWRLGLPYRWRGRKLYRDAFYWEVSYLGTMLVLWVPAIALNFLALSIGFDPDSVAVQTVGIVAALAMMVAALGLPSGYFYARDEARKMKVSRGRAFGAYLLVVLTANAAYLAFAAAYAALVGAL